MRSLDNHGTEQKRSLSYVFSDRGTVSGSRLCACLAPTLTATLPALPASVEHPLSRTPLVAKPPRRPCQYQALLQLALHAMSIQLSTLSHDDYINIIRIQRCLDIQWHQTLVRFNDSAGSLHGRGGRAAERLLAPRRARDQAGSYSILRSHERQSLIVSQSVQ